MIIVVVQAVFKQDRDDDLKNLLGKVVVIYFCDLSRK